jgi:hypothetical protein
MVAALLPQRLRATGDLIRTLTKARLLAPMSPAAIFRMAAAVRHEGMSTTTGFAIAAARCPNRPGLVDDIGTHL